MEQIEECISFLLGKAYQQINHTAKRLLARYGVTPVQYALLKVLWEQDGQSGAALGERLRLDAATITGIIDRLVAAELIERRAHATDRRINSVFLTERGQALQEPLDREMDALNAESFDRFSPDDAARLRTMLIELGNGGPTH